MHFFGVLVSVERVWSVRLKFSDSFMHTTTLLRTCLHAFVYYHTHTEPIINCVVTYGRIICTERFCVCLLGGCIVLTMSCESTPNNARAHRATLFTSHTHTRVMFRTLARTAVQLSPRTRCCYWLCVICCSRVCCIIPISGSIKTVRRRRNAIIINRVAFTSLRAST